MYQDYPEIKKYFNELNAQKYHYNNSNDICTPMECVKEMVDAIPEEFWQRECISILDPCAGNGNFPAYLITKTSIKNIQMNEINPIRVKNLREYFNNEANVTEQDFLKFSTNKKFDLIIANPPFAKFMENGQRAAKNHSLSREFLKKAYDLINDNGYIVFILPDNWMSYADRNNMPKLLSAYHFVELNLGECKKYFPGVGSSFTWFVWKKEKNDLPTIIHNGYKIKDTQEVILPSNVSYIPLYCHPLVQNIFNKVINSTGEKYKIQTSSNLHKYTKAHLLNTIKTDEFKYEIVHTPSQTVWSKQPHIYQDGWKVYIATTTNYQTFIKKDCGMTQSIAFILCDNEEEAIRINEELQQPVYKMIVALTRYGNFNNIRILQNMTVFNKLNLTKEENEIVAKINKIYYKST